MFRQMEVSFITLNKSKLYVPFLYNNIMSLMSGFEGPLDAYGLAFEAQCMAFVLSDSLI